MYTGRLEVCLDGMFVPVCTSALSDYDLGEICSDVLYGDGK